jgi:ferredoxin
MTGMSAPSGSEVEIIDWVDLEHAILAAGMRPRGAFECVPEDGVPVCQDGSAARAVVLLGGVGGSLWPVFSNSAEFLDGEAHGLDRWSRRVIGELASALGATALYPFEGPPYLPFQRWARRAEPLWPSPMGALIHPRYGLWHAYRGALAFPELPAGLPPREALANPCESCEAKPCMTTCPVGAIGSEGYDVSRCVRHISLPDGTDCMSQSCRARRACPVGREYLYETAQSRFHMEAFLKGAWGRG